MELVLEPFDLALEDRGDLFRTDLHVNSSPRLGPGY
jgi:hypothetical protein